MEKYIIDADKVLIKAKKLLGDNEDKWDRITTKNGTSLFKYDSSNNSEVPHYLVSTIIDKPINDLVDIIWRINENEAKKRDATLTDCKNIEKSEYHRIYSQHHSMTWPVWPRHLVYAQVKFDEGDVIYIVSYSIKHPKVPLDEDNYVRSHIHMSVYEFKEINRVKTSVKRIAQIDPCGTIPTVIVNTFTNNQVNIFNTWKQ
jgi:hypothetical protein